jgi:hypothetical protein
MPRQGATRGLLNAPRLSADRLGWTPPRLCTNLLAGLALSLVIVTGVTVGSGGAQGTRSESANACTLEPLGVPLFGGTPAAIIAATPALPAAAVAADPATIQEAASVIVACINTGDPSLEYAVFTPRYLGAQFVDGAGHYQPEFELRLDSPARPVSPAFTLEAVEGIEIEADGRVRVTLVLRSAQATLRDTFLLASIDGQWLIDEVLTLDPAP